VKIAALYDVHGMLAALDAVSAEHADNLNGTVALARA